MSPRSHPRHTERAPEPAWDGGTTAQRIYERAFRKANGPGATARDRAALASAYRLVRAEQKRRGQAVDRALAREQQAADAAQRRTRCREVRAALYQKYGDLGPQYAILVDVVARAVAWAEEADEKGDRSECAAWDRMVRESVAALQRFTESTKEPIIQKRIREKVRIVLEIVEQEIAPQAPELWLTALRALEQRLPHRK